MNQHLLNVVLQLCPSSSKWLWYDRNELKNISQHLEEPWQNLLRFSKKQFFVVFLFHDLYTQLCICIYCSCHFKTQNRLLLYWGQSQWHTRGIHRTNVGASTTTCLSLYAFFFLKTSFLYNFKDFTWIAATCMSRFLLSIFIYLLLFLFDKNY